MSQSRSSDGHRPRVGVVIPVYNRPAAVCRAIRSVLRQTHQNFEIVVVDDCSTDDTLAAVREIHDPRISLLRHDRNRGPAAARNTGARATSAPFLAFLDSDDEWFETFFERHLLAFEQGGDSVGMVYAGAERLSPGGSVHVDVPREYGDLSHVLLRVNVVGGPSVAMVRRRVFDAIGGFDEHLKFTEDADFWLRISQRFEIRCVPEVLARIAQQTEEGRLSGDMAAVTYGREMLCRKHRQTLRDRGVLHVYLRDSGWLQQRWIRNSRLARQLYFESLRANPAAPLTYVLLLSAYLPTSCLDIMARCKQFALRFLPSSYPLTSTAKPHPNMPTDSTVS